jgi:serine O-acetyltransferase
MKFMQMDLERAIGHRTSMFKFVRTFVVDSGFKAIVYYRLANWLMRKGIPYLPSLITAHSVSKTGAEIMPSARIGHGLSIKHSVGIVIGGGSEIGNHCTILQNVTLGEKYSQDGRHLYPSLGNNVTVCAGAVIIGGIEIGENSIIGANSVVLGSVPKNSIFAGMPAKKIGEVMA